MFTWLIKDIENEITDKVLRDLYKINSKIEDLNINDQNIETLITLINNINTIKNREVVELLALDCNLTKHGKMIKTISKGE